MAFGVEDVMVWARAVESSFFFSSSYKGMCSCAVDHPVVRTSSDRQILLFLFSWRKPSFHGVRTGKANPQEVYATARQILAITSIIVHITDVNFQMLGFSVTK